MSRRKLRSIGGIALFFVGLMIFNKIDMTMNYEPVEAEVTDVAKDCYIEGFRKKIVYRGTNITAHFECALASDIAQEFGMPEHNIHVRYQVEYTYKSPADGDWHEGRFTTTALYTEVDEEDEAWYEGRVFKVYAHKKRPSKSKVFMHDLEFDEGNS